eukprot:CAMPEP_0198292678 /NCGR_PEP_ID=MMETSP1449-20131203/13353_1 /TAXON_ID=420275 /ORGANISM="Attheya septentrionalis, Strain CCMP2084" /LENGTH=326 /DNA_ID=CAMNT_0043991905 /DNA_START=151 /DNA_END=1131 /DNA_ORIENTATION=+
MDKEKVKEKMSEYSQMIMSVVSSVSRHAWGRYADVRKEVIGKKLLPRVPADAVKHLEVLTTKINAKLSSALEPMTVAVSLEDVTVLLMAIVGLPFTYVLYRTGVVAFAAEVYFTFIYPMVVTLQTLKNGRHDKVPPLLTYWMLLMSSLLLVEPLFCLRTCGGSWIVPNLLHTYYVPLKCTVCYALVSKDMAFVHQVLVERIILPALGFQPGRGTAIRHKSMRDAVEAAADHDSDSSYEHVQIKTTDTTDSSFTTTTTTSSTITSPIKTTTTTTSTSPSPTKTVSVAPSVSIGEAAAGSAVSPPELIKEISPSISEDSFKTAALTSL